MPLHFNLSTPNSSIEGTYTYNIEDGQFHVSYRSMPIFMSENNPIEPTFDMVIKKGDSWEVFQPLSDGSLKPILFTETEQIKDYILSHNIKNGEVYIKAIESVVLLPIDGQPEKQLTHIAWVIEPFDTYSLNGKSYPDGVSMWNYLQAKLRQTCRKLKCIDGFTLPFSGKAL